MSTGQQLLFEFDSPVTSINYHNGNKQRFNGRQVRNVSTYVAFPCSVYLIRQKHLGPLDIINLCGSRQKSERRHQKVLTYHAN